MDDSEAETLRLHDSPLKPLSKDVSSDLSDVDEEEEQRQNAIAALTDIELEFAELRNQLHEQQICKFDLEIRMVEQGSHPELEKYNKQLLTDRDRQLERTEKLLEFELNAINKQTHATKCLAHQTFLNSKMNLRREINAKIQNKWSKLHLERGLEGEVLEIGNCADDLRALGIDV